MALTKKQKELDIVKWEKSIAMGQDACGTFDYCEKCDKTLENPCDKAYTKFNAKPAAKKTEKPAKTVKPATVKTEKPKAKKTTK